MHAISFFLGTAYGNLPYDSFQIDTTTQRYERIVDTTLRPRSTQLSEAESTQVLRATDDATSVQFDTQNGEVTLVGDDFLNGALAAVGDGEVVSDTEFDISTIRDQINSIAQARWTHDSVASVMANQAKLEDEFLRLVGIKLRKSTARRTLWGYGWLTEDASFGLKYKGSERDNDIGRFVDVGIFKEITDTGLNGKGGYAEVLNGNFYINIEVPENWSSFEVAEYIVSVLRGQAGEGLAGLDAGSLETVFDEFLKAKLADGEVSVEEAMSSYKTSVLSGLKQLLADIKEWTETAVSIVPGASGPTAVYEWQEGKKLSALFTLLTSGVVGSVIAKKLGGVAVKTFDGLVEVLPQRALEQLARHPKEKDALVKILTKTPGGLDEQLEVTRKFFAKNSNTLGAAGSLVKETDTSTLWRIIHAADPSIPRKAQYQVHHLVPWAQVQGSDAFKVAADAGYDINNAKNLMPLPSDEKLALTDLLPLHRGKHPSKGEAGEYVVFVTREIEKIDALWANNRLTYNGLFDKIDDLSDRLRQGLENLEWKLSRKDPH